MSRSGIFTVSLDFELYWGTRDHASLAQYGRNILGAHSAIPELLALFEEFEVHATWAIVGLLALENVEEAGQFIPGNRPSYALEALDPYVELDRVRGDPERAQYFFAPDLVRRICATPYQELGSHTFCHYYCLEKGQTVEQFDADLQAMKALGERRLQRPLTSLVFPRNQTSEDHLALCARAGIRAFRGNQRSWVYAARAGEDESPLRRAARLADAYVNLTGHHGHRVDSLGQGAMVDVPASRFLRPYSHRLRFLEPLRLKRIQADMSHCARRGLMYHLWWHPENFGVNLNENKRFLRSILEHYKRLRQEEAMESKTMGEVAELSARLQGTSTAAQLNAQQRQTVSESR